MLINSNKIMNTKQYQKVRIAIVILISFLFSQGLMLHSFLIPMFVLVIASLVLLYLRGKVEGIVADERDYTTAGKAALLAIQAYSWLGVAAMLALYANSDLNPAYEPIALSLSFSICILMLLYSVLFRYYNRIKFSDKGLVYAFAVLVLFIIMAFGTLRVFSGEDSWICQDGNWIKHGNPSFSAPTTECK